MPEIEIPPRVLVVGGTDPTSGAGLFRDVQTLSGLGVYVTGVVAAVTVQTSRSVSDVVALPASVVGAQMDAALEEIGTDVVKTGMLGTLDVVHAVADRVERLGAGARLVIDPVLVASSGRALLAADGVQAMLERLVPRAALVTPNLLEAERLTGIAVRSREDMGRAADVLLAHGASAVLIKGGHLPEFDPELDEIGDLLRTLDGDEFWITRSRRLGPSRRGTGCTLASAIAGGIALGLTLRDAVESARSALDRAWETAPPLGKKAGPLGFVAVAPEKVPAFEKS